MMNIISDDKSLHSIVSRSNEIIIYGAGNMGKVLIKHLSEYGWKDKIVCCAVTNFFGLLPPRETLGVDILELRYLSHYRKTACFIIAVGEDKQKEMIQNLTEFGCENAYVLKYTYELELEVGQNKKEALGTKILEEVSNLTKKVNALQCQLAEQNEICATHSVSFSEFRGCNQGKNVTIVASGPSMVHYKPLPEMIYMGMNNAYKRKDISFDYFFVQDAGDKNSSIRDSGYQMFNGICRNVTGTIFVGRMLRNSVYRECEFPMNIMENDKRFRRYWLEAGWTTDYPRQDFYQNICFHPLLEYRSVVFPVIQFALFTHPKKIYLVGCDVSDDGHFDDPLDILIGRTHMKFGYAKIKEFAEQYYPDTEIISINPIGLRGLFHDVYTENFLSKHPEIDPSTCEILAS